MKPTDKTIRDIRLEKSRKKAKNYTGKYTRHYGYIQFKYAGFEIWGMKYRSRKDRRNKIEYFTKKFSNYAFEIHIRPYLKDYKDLRFKKEILDNVSIAAWQT